HVAAGAHLLAALHGRFPAESVFLAVVDPGVGSDRDAVVLRADGCWYVGPDNGLLSVIAARAAKRQTWRITWRPPALSASFHGRDLFAPIAAWLACGDSLAGKTEDTSGLSIQLGAGDLAEIIHIDHYGNPLTGVRAKDDPRTATLVLAGQRLAHARVFGYVPAGTSFCYE